MKKIILISVVFIFTISCARMNVPVSGGLFIDHQGPSQIVSTGILAKKKGTACSTGILGVVTGDSSINAAAKDGRIKKITHIDHHVKNILYGIYIKFCTIVYGR